MVDVGGLLAISELDRLSVRLTFTRNSRRGCGVKSARTVVTMGPSIPHSTILSDSLITPFDKMTSIVVPSPSMTFTSSMVHSSSEMYIKLWFIRS